MLMVPHSLRPSGHATYRGTAQGDFEMQYRLTLTHWTASSPRSSSKHLQDAANRGPPACKGRGGWAAGSQPRPPPRGSMCSCAAGQNSICRPVCITLKPGMERSHDLDLKTMEHWSQRSALFACGSTAGKAEIQNLARSMLMTSEQGNLPKVSLTVDEPVLFMRI